MLARVIDPARELFTRRNGPRRIIGKTEINKIGVFCRWVGDKSVLSCARQIKNSLVAPVFSRRAAAARHHVRIDVNQIDRSGARELGLLDQDIQERTANAL